jgi:oxygen-independent coproporphyrinogen-3 oxidase
MFGIKIEGIYGPVIERLIADGLLKREGVWISLTEWGMDVSNFVLSEFLL